MPNKNILELAGKPLIAWSIESGLTSKYIDKLIVSTDNQQIADIAKFIGAEVPFLRPDSISTDESPTIDTLIHAINYLKNINQNYHYLALLEPTSPLRDVSDIDIPIEVLEKKRKIADSIVGVCKTESTHPAFSLEIHKRFNKAFSIS